MTDAKHTTGPTRIHPTEICLKCQMLLLQWSPAEDSEEWVGADCGCDLLDENERLRALMGELMPWLEKLEIYDFEGDTRAVLFQTVRRASALLAKAETTK